jgi:hypothetical protein
LDGGHNLGARNMPSTGHNPAFEQPHNLTGGQVRVKLPGDSNEPSVNTLARVGRRSQQVVEE